MLSSYEQSKNLTIALLEKWLVDYKFKDWNKHRTDPDKLQQPVTIEEKKERAMKIAKDLGDNKRWHSHGRMISARTLQNELKLEIDDYSENIELRGLIRNYNDLLIEFIAKNNFKVFFHNRKFFL